MILRYVETMIDERHRGSNVLHTEGKCTCNEQKAGLYVLGRICILFRKCLHQEAWFECASARLGL